MTWHVYILECQDGSYYTGIAKNVQERMKQHKKGNGSKYVASKGFKKLLYSFKAKNRSQASKYEYNIKQLKKYEKTEFFRNKTITNK